MSTLTPHYSLEKPAGSDYYDVNVQNGNMEKIDTALHDLEQGKADLGEDGKVPVEQMPADYSPSIIDCGVWDTDPVAEHNYTATAHANLLVDGNNTESADTAETLEEHMVNPLAHQNLVIDGNAGQ